MPNPEHDQPTIDRVAREVAAALGDGIGDDEDVIFIDGYTLEQEYRPYETYLSDHRTAARYWAHVESLIRDRCSSLTEGSEMEYHMQNLEDAWGVTTFMQDAWANPLSAIIELWRVVGSREDEQ